MVAIGNTIAYSSDNYGTNWTSITSSPFYTTNTTYKNVKWLNNRFIAFSSDAVNRIAYSYDGITWNSATTANTLFSTCATGGEIAAALPHTIKFPQNMTITGNLVSYNQGGSWSTIPGISSLTSNSAGWNGTYFLFGNTNGALTMVSDDLNIGTVVNTFTDTVPTIIEWNGSMWLLGGSSNTNKHLQYSYDGINWFSTGQIYFTTTGTVNGISWNGQIWVVSGTITTGNVLMYSADGINWAAPVIAPYAVGGGPVDWNGLYFLCGSSSTSGGTIVYQSADGVGWVAKTIGSYGLIKSICNNGTAWILTTTPPNTSTAGILVSYDGVSWSGVGGGIAYDSYLGSCWNGFAFIVNTTTNVIRYSYDGTNWSNTTISTQNGNAVIWTNPHMGKMDILQPTLVGGSGTYNTMAYSADGIQYRGLGNSIFTGSCNDIGWNGSIWVAVGSGGGNTIAYSPDGLSWKALGSTVFSDSGYGISWNGTVWLALGSGTGNTMATSTDGKTWTGIGKPVFDMSGLYAEWNGQAWIAGGQGSINTLAVSTSITASAGSWTGLGSSIISGPVQSVKWMSNKWVAGGGVGSGSNVFAYTSDITGMTGWTASPTSLSSTMNTSVNSIFWNGSIAVAVGTGSSHTIATSTDGINWTGRNNTTFTVAGYDVMWNTKRWIITGYGGNTVAYSYNGTNWYGVVNSTSLFDSSGGYAVCSNPKIGAFVVPSTLYMNVNDRIVVNAPKYYDEGISSDTSISLQMNLP
jgi:hypothetical protein